MAQPNQQTTKITAAKPEKQILRQQQVKKIQQLNKKLDESQLPQQLPIHDKYIFGLTNLKPLNNNAQQQENLEVSNRYSAHSYAEIWDKKEFIHTSTGGNFCCYSAGIDNNNLIFVCLHGCGHSALSYSLIAKLMKEKYQIFSFDYRGHGYTTFDKQDEKDEKDKKEEYKMSKNNLVSDIIEIIKLKYGIESIESAVAPIVLVGHSLGGALAIHSAVCNLIPQLVGIVVIDLVEGTALNSLIHMRSIINRRPKSFKNIQEAIKYCSTSGMIRNYKSAQYSVPPMFIKNTETNKLIWRTNVLLSQPYWREWFIGLSGLFLKSPCSKMLMLADTDRLDKPLTIGQMQGKYQLCIVGCGVGHTLHEDAPQKVANKLIHFVERNQFIKLWQINKKFKLKPK